jgi:hypothetical protein
MAFKSGVTATAVQDGKRCSARHEVRAGVVECGGKRSATPLSSVRGRTEDKQDTWWQYGVQKRCHGHRTPRRQALFRCRKIKTPSVEAEGA